MVDLSTAALVVGLFMLGSWTGFWVGFRRGHREGVELGRKQVNAERHMEAQLLRFPKRNGGRAVRLVTIADPDDLEDEWEEDDE